MSIVLLHLIYIGFIGWIHFSRRITVCICMYVDAVRMSELILQYQLEQLSGSRLLANRILREFPFSYNTRNCYYATM